MTNIFGGARLRASNWRNQMPQSFEQSNENLQQINEDSLTDCQEMDTTLDQLNEMIDFMIEMLEQNPEDQN
ncbi:hypothetical protein HC928_04135 [bacterium]|nr:hypothetical protein [bacterium]